MTTRPNTQVDYGGSCGTHHGEEEDEEKDKRLMSRKNKEEKANSQGEPPRP